MHGITTCPGADHRNHATVTCNHSCCAECGGPIDEHDECRCTSDDLYIAFHGEPRDAGRPDYDAETDRERYERAAQERR